MILFEGDSAELSGRSLRVTCPCVAGLPCSVVLGFFIGRRENGPRSWSDRCKRERSAQDKKRQNKHAILQSVNRRGKVAKFGLTASRVDAIPRAP